eukprot:666794-Rhodomonas_salina.1
MLPQWIMIRCSSPQLARILNGTLTLAYGAVPGRASRTDQRSALPGGATRGRRDEPRIRKREDSPRRAGGAGRVRALSHAMREGGSLRGLFRVLAVRAAMTDSACVLISGSETEYAVLTQAAPDASVLTGGGITFTSAVPAVSLVLGGAQR